MNHYQSGIDAFKRGDIEWAILAFRDAIDENPEDIKSYGALGWVFYTSGDFATSVEWFAKAVACSRYPFYEIIYHLRYALALSKSGDFKKSADVLEYCIRLRPYDTDIYKQLIFQYQAMGSYEKVISLRRELSEMLGESSNESRAAQAETLHTDPDIGNE